MRTGHSAPSMFEQVCEAAWWEMERDQLLEDDHTAAVDPVFHIVAVLELHERAQYEAWAL